MMAHTGFPEGKRPTIARRFWWVFLALAGLCAGPSAQALPGGEEVVRHVREARQGIRDYTVDVDVRVEMTGARLPDVSLRVLHKSPDKTKLQPLKGFAILPKGTLVAGDPFAGLVENATVKVTGSARLSGRPVYALRITPDAETAPRGAQPLEAWVDAERWNVLKLRSHTPSGEPVTVEITYERVADKYWLPSRTVARMPLPAAAMAAASEATGPSQLPADAPETPAASKPGTVTVTFRNYRLNTGLSDSLFTESTRRGTRSRRR